LNTAVDSSGTFSFGNPATLSNTTLTNLEFGATFSNVRQQNATSRSDYNTGMFEYVGLAIPISLKRGVAVALGLSPYSKVNYFIQNEALVDGDSVFTSYEGSGGLDQFKIAIGFKVYKGLSFGVGSSAVFGNIKNNADKLYKENTNKYSFRDLTTNYYSGWMHNFGVQYTRRTGKKTFHTFAANYKLGSNIEVTQDRFIRTYNGAGDFFIDTILKNTDEPKSLSIPAGYSLAYGIGDRGHWYFGFQYSSDQWTSYSDLNGLQNYFNQTTYSVGGYFQAKSYAEFETYAGRKERKQKYLEVARFYYGFNMTNLYINSFSEQITELGINIGVGFPIMRTVHIDEKQKIGVISRVNVGVGYTMRGGTENGLIQENVLEIRVGTNFNDKWFTKRKYQ